MSIIRHNGLYWATINRGATCVAPDRLEAMRLALGTFERTRGAA